MNTTIRNLGIIGLAALLIFGMIAFVGSADKTGYVNVQRILSESDIGKKKMAEYARLRENKNKILEEQLAVIDSLKGHLKKERDKKKIKYITERIERKNKEVKRYAADVEKVLAESDVESVNEVLKKVAPILKKIGNKRGYAIILKNIDDIAYLGPGVDITTEVITKLNKTR
ncbi:MAG: OmpH family outer membrane protein [Thermodesulfobacteriota bacterium]|nr:OmpH family outer membrane protein [Thermodesulfobacteriota bacterium]